MSALAPLRSGFGPLDALMRWVDRLTALLSALGTLMILALMLLISADVIGRSFFAHPIAGVTEMVSMSILAIVFLQIANTTAQGKLTRSDALLGALQTRRPRAGDAVDAVLHLVGAVMTGVLVSAFYPQFLRSYGRNEMIGTVGQFLAPIWPVHGMVLLGAALMCLVFALRALALAIRAIRGTQA